MKRTNIKYIAYILLILLINHECIAIANTINHQVLMKKTIDHKIKQQMAKNMYADAMKTTDNVADDIAKNVDDVGKSADGVPQRVESGDEIGAAVEESGMKEEMKNFDTKKKSDHYEGHNVLDPRL